ncbi:MAG: helix-turn-helix domain-containing protein [Rhodobacteraceae bacterium]|nr:helix-turn-helix domain-containing protein [Paracoccaceae bacterium]
MILRKIRLERGWSQEQLSELSGVSTRTIQRIERGKKASLETLKCLAAVFETEINHLQQEPEMTEPLTAEDRAALSKVKEWMHYDDDGYVVDPSLSAEERDALSYVREVKGFYAHLITFVAVMLALLVINLLTSPEYFWVVWPALGWGIGLVVHGIGVFEIFSLFGPEWEKKQMEKRLRKK